MIKFISSAFAALAVVTFAGLTGQASAQHCSSCASAQSVGNFSYPAAGYGQAGQASGTLGHGRIKGHVDEVKRQLDFRAANNSKIAARNDAWPKPFACADKRAYYNVWSAMLHAGGESHAVLDSNFFTGDNNLNRVGIDRVAGIVLNNPSDERVVYVNRGANGDINQARVDSIRNTISTYYSHLGSVDVRLSDRLPQSVTGRSIEQLQQGRIPSLPPAIIPIEAASSVTSAVGQ